MSSAKTKGEELLSLAEAARRIGFQGARGLPLKRALLAKEKKHRRQIMIRLEGAKRVQLRVTISLLHRWCPEFFASKQDTLAKDFRKYLRDLNEQLDERIAEKITETVQPHLDQINDRLEKLHLQLTGSSFTQARTSIPKHVLSTRR